MKKNLLFIFIFTITLASFSQRTRTMQRKDVKAPMVNTSQETPMIGSKAENPFVSVKSMLDDPQIMMTGYDLQSNNSSGQQRIYYFPDGTMGGVATMSHENGGSWTDSFRRYHDVVAKAGYQWTQSYLSSRNSADLAYRKWRCNI